MWVIWSAIEKKTKANQKEPPAARMNDSCYQIVFENEDQRSCQRFFQSLGTILKLTAHPLALQYTACPAHGIEAWLRLWLPVPQIGRHQTPREWGPPMWRFLYEIVALYTYESGSLAPWLDFIENVSHVLPCQTCRTHMRAFMQTNPLRHRRNPESVREWLDELRQAIRVSLTSTPSASTRKSTQGSRNIERPRDRIQGKKVCRRCGGR